MTYVLYSMVLRTGSSGHELSRTVVQQLPCSVSVVLFCAYLHVRVYLRLSFVSPSHSLPYCDFYTAWLCLFTILLEIVVRNNQCFELLSMFVLLFEIEAFNLKVMVRFRE